MHSRHLSLAHPDTCSGVRRISEGALIPPLTKTGFLGQWAHHPVWLAGSQVSWCPWSADLGLPCGSTGLQAGKAGFQASRQLCFACWQLQSARSQEHTRSFPGAVLQDEACDCLGSLRESRSY